MSQTSALRVLITGGTGYLGAALLRHLGAAQPSWELHATHLTHAPSFDGPHWHRLDLRDAREIASLFSYISPQIVVHTAALMRGDLETLRSANAWGSGMIARQARESRARLVHLSTDVIFDGIRGNYTEDDLPNPITPYGQAKWEAEQEVRASGANSVIVRTSLIYGFNPIDPRTAAVLDGTMARLFSDEMRCPVWVDDLCRALEELAESGYTGVLNVAGSQTLSRYEFGCKLARALGSDERRLIPVLSSESGLVRPRDCTLDLTRARSVLRTRLHKVDEVFQLIDSCPF